MTDSRPVISGVSSLSRESVIQSQVGKLARCDEDLSLIASEMTQLQDELTQFRAYADELARRISEREASLDEKELALSRLEEERTLARQQADGVSAELREAEARLSRHAQRVATLEQEVETLQAGIDEREHRLADHAVELSGVRDALAGRERNPEQARTIAKSAEHGRAGHVRFIALPTGYGLSVSEEPCPRRGEFVEVDGTHFLVASRGLSPLPGDARPCAFLWPGKGRHKSSDVADGRETGSSAALVEECPPASP
jgi:DNA repair exonuclease SbcCD ATPase subunit